MGDRGRRAAAGLHRHPTVAHSHDVSRGIGPAAGIGKSGEIFEPVQRHVDRLHPDEGDLRRKRQPRRRPLLRRELPLRTHIHPPRAGDRTTGQRTVPLPDDRIHAADKNRTDREPDHHLPLLLRTARHLLRSGDQPLVPRRTHRHLCLDGTALYKTQQKLDSINHKLAMGSTWRTSCPGNGTCAKGRSCAT